MNYFLVILLFYSLIISGCVERKELGSEKNPIKISLVPGQDVGVLMDNGNILADYLKKQTGLHFQVYVPNNFVAVVETFGTRRTDMAIMNSFGYLLSRDKYQTHVRLVGTNNGRAEYWGQIITAKPNIKKISDLNKKKFAFVDPASTSGFILPSSFLKKNNIKLSETVFAGKHDTVVSLVYQKRVDAGATYHTPEQGQKPQDARKLVETQYPDVFNKVRIIEKIGPIPSDPVVFAKDFPRAIEDKIVAELIQFSKTEIGKNALMKLYNLDGFKEIDDSFYNPLREMIQDIGKAPADYVN
jgi:phosphonate transport system substrate-binding protein